MNLDTSATREAQLLINIGRAKEAIPILTRAISADPQCVKSLCLLSLALFKLERYEESLSVAGDAAVADPQTEWPHRLRTLNLVRLKRNEEALNAATLAARVGPNVPEALHQLAICQADNGKLKEAQSTAEALLLLAPGNPMSHHAAGFLALRESRWADAEMHCRKALAIEPTHWESMNNLGLALKRQDKRIEAIERFHDAARLNPKSGTARTNLRETVGAYMTVDYLGIYVFFLLINAGVVCTSSEYRLLAMVMGGVAFMTFVAAHSFKYSLRMARLNENVKLYYLTEKQRIRRQHSQGAIGCALFAITGIVLTTTVFLAIVNAIVDKGERLPISGFCAILALVLVAELITLTRRK